jgi:hypothetical protein
MIAATTTVQQSEIRQFLQASLRAIVRAEAQGRLPARFTGTGVAVWETFRHELTPADLVALCVQDAGGGQGAHHQLPDDRYAPDLVRPTGQRG